MELTQAQRDIMVDSAERCLAWMSHFMMDKPDGSRGIWERVRINIGEVVYWVRPDCTTEAAIAFMVYSRMKGDAKSRDIAYNLLNTVLGMQQLRGAFPFYQYYPPDLIGTDVNLNVGGGLTLWPNDNGKVLGLISRFGSDFEGMPVREAVRRLCVYFMASQTEQGWWCMNNTHYPGTCFVAWPVYGLSRAYVVTGDPAVKQCALKGLNYLKSLQLPDGRMKTSYEISKVENWRPVSSEAAESLLAFSTAQECLGVDCSEEIDKLIKFLETLTDPTGAIRNCSPSCMDASEQNNAQLTDLVYTNGYALHAWLTAYRVTGREECRIHAQKLALFLASVQCRDENPLWNGGWRGSYDLVKGEWSGRADQQNELDEGGMYSVYTGWCSATNTTGLLLASQL